MINNNILSSIKQFGDYSFKDNQTTEKKYLLISSKDKIIFDNEKSGKKLALVDIAKKCEDFILKNNVLNNFEPEDLIKIKTGLDKLKNKLENFYKKHPIKTIFLNIFSFGRFGKSNKIFEKIISKVKEIEIEKNKKVENKIKTNDNKKQTKKIKAKNIDKKTEKNEKILKSDQQKEKTSSLKISQINLKDKSLKIKTDTTDKNFESNFKSLMSKIEEAASKDLYLDDEHIYQKFEINKFIESLSKEKKDQVEKQIHLMINKAYIKRIKQQKGTLVSGDFHETLLMDLLNLKNLDKKKIVQEIERKLDQLKDDILQLPLSKVKEEINRISFESRLEAIGLKTEDQIKNFILLKDLLISCLKNYNKYAENFFPFFSIEGFSENSPNIKGLKKKHESKIEDSIQEYMKNKFLKIGDYLRDSEENFKIKLENLKQELKTEYTEARKEIKELEKNIEKKTKKRIDSKINLMLSSVFELNQSIAFMEKWGSHIKSELVQGIDDPNEVFGEGICFGLCQNLEMLAQNNPNWSLEELIEKNTIHSQQRFLQSQFDTALRLEKPVLTLPEKFGTRLGFKEESSFVLADLTPKPNFNFSEIAKAEQAKDIRVTKPSEIFNDLVKHITAGVDEGKWTKSNGWMRLSLTGENHTIALRLDPQTNKAWLFDPNIGYLAFEGSNFKENKEQCLACLKELIECEYPKVFRIAVSHLTKLPVRKSF